MPRLPVNLSLFKATAANFRLQQFSAFPVPVPWEGQGEDERVSATAAFCRRNPPRGNSSLRGPSLSTPFSLFKVTAIESLQSPGLRLIPSGSSPDEFKTKCCHPCPKVLGLLQPQQLNCRSQQCSTRIGESSRKTVTQLHVDQLNKPTSCCPGENQKSASHKSMLPFTHTLNAGCPLLHHAPEASRLVQL